MNIPLEKLSKFALIFALAAFFLAASFGFGHLGVPMAMEVNVAATDCPYMPGVSVCSMALFEHISSWQGIFTALPLKQNSFSGLLSLILAFLAALFGFSWFSRTHLSLKLFPAWLSSNNGKYIPETFLKEALSDGILNPKLF